MASRRWATVQLLWSVCVLAACMVNFEGALGKETLHRETFRSPGFVLGPGDVIDRYIRVEMPTGHIAVRSLDMNLVTADGTSVPLSETYLHHWVLLRYYLDPKDKRDVNILTQAVPNHGVCNPLLVQYFGLGSEFRKTNTTIPAPYGIVLGNPADVPEGREEQWYLNVHAIDTRGVESTIACTECLCDVYNVTKDGYGRDLPPNYEGGIYCCHDQTRCPLREGFQASQAPQRELFLEFFVTFVDYSDAVVPVKVYLLDVTDRRTAWGQEPECGVEYTVPKSTNCVKGGEECLHTQEAVAFLPEGGYVIVSKAHLHSSGKLASISLENGTDICVSHPIYGQGNEAGDEKGYVVGMTGCNPDPKAIYIRPKEKLRLRAVYNNTERHTGVMGILSLLIAEGPPPPSTLIAEGPPPPSTGYSVRMVLATLTIVAAAIFAGVTMYQNRSKRRDKVKYKPVV